MSNILQLEHSLILHSHDTRGITDLTNLSVIYPSFYKSLNNMSVPPPITRISVAQQSGSNLLVLAMTFASNGTPRELAAAPLFLQTEVTREC